MRGGVCCPRSYLLRYQALCRVQPYEGEPREWERLSREFQLRIICDYAKGEETYSSAMVRNGTDLCGRINEVTKGENLDAEFEAYAEDKKRA